jgi:hypothetical protein
MGFGCSWARGGLGIRSGLSRETRRRRSEAGGCKGIERPPEVWNVGFSAAGHTCNARAEARGAFANSDVSLRAVKNLYPVRLLPLDLLGG